MLPNILSGEFVMRNPFKLFSKSARNIATLLLAASLANGCGLALIDATYFSNLSVVKALIASGALLDERSPDNGKKIETGKVCHAHTSARTHTHTHM